MDSNLLIKGDNIDGLQWLLDNGFKGKIDLVYIDPPFATGGSFGIDPSGRVSTISRAEDAAEAYSDQLQGEEYIEYLRRRVALIYELLSDRGSFYLHIDYKIGHYVKVMLDGIFGMKYFRNDITRVKCNPKNFDRNGYGNIKDMILYYVKSDSAIWNNPVFGVEESDLKKRYPKTDASGRRYTTVPIHAPGETKGNTSLPFRGLLPPKGRHWRCSVEELEELDRKGLIEWSSTGNPRKINYADEHTSTKAQDIWTFKDPVYPTYPTEKNQDMLRFIVGASSNPDSIVMDCFCGSGSLLRAAGALGRKWIGMDKSALAIKVTKDNLSAESGMPSRGTDFMEI